MSSSSCEYSLSFEEFQSVVRKGQFNLIPLYISVPADLETPVSAFLKVRQHGSHSFLLESVEGGERQARYSFIGTEPYKVLRQDDCDPLDAVQSEMKQFKAMPIRGLPNLAGGAIGFVSYDCVRHFEPSIEFSDENALGVPESVFMFCTSIVAFDHAQHTAKVIAHCRVSNIADIEDDAQVRVAYCETVARLHQVAVRLDHPVPETLLPTDVANREADTCLRSNHDQAGYEGFVNTLREHIRQGDIIQAVPSHRVARQLNFGVGAFDVYRQLRVINPSPYMFYLDFGDFEIVGASPEQLVKVDARRRITVHPIAGTRRRGASDDEDDRLAKELLENEKERAEHIMLVDLGRNDVGRVSKPGSVRVDSLMHIEKYSHVMHIVSHVSGQLLDNVTCYDAFRAVFPAGTVSGAPKMRAMQLVASLEKERRGVYAGAVGYIDFNGVMDTCISIRTVVIKDGIAYLQAGGGIVHDSEPTSEYVETVNKMRALARAIDAAEQKRVADAAKKASCDALDCKGDQGRGGVHRNRDTVMKNYETPVMNIPSKFGRFGGAYVPETLVGVLADLEREYISALNDPGFLEELRSLQKHYVGRPTPLYFAKRITDHCGGARVWLKREDLAHTGAHKINNALGQGLLAKRMGKKRIIAETGAGQHGVATATACALLELECIVYMGVEDIKRQALNVFRMKMLGATVVPVTSGSRTLKDAVNEAIRDWVTNVRTTMYLIGSAIGPSPFPTIVRDFQCCIGEEVRAQMLEQAGRLPDVAVACVGGGSNAIGLFHPLLDDLSVELVGVEAGGCGVSTGKHSATLIGGRMGVLHGTKTYLLQDDDGQIMETHSISAGLDYPGVGPEHAFLKESGRVRYVAVNDDEALQGLRDLTKLEGIIPALETAHAVYHGMELASGMRNDQDILINLSGRGDKDMYQVADALGVKLLSNE